MNVKVKGHWSFQETLFYEYEYEGTKYEGTKVPSSNPLFFIIKIYQYKKLIIFYRYILHFIIFYNLKI